MECSNHLHGQDFNPTRNHLIKVLIISLTLNLFCCVGIGIFIYQKKDKIVELLGKNQTNPTENVLAKFNSRPLDFHSDSIMSGSSETLSFLFLGNSITRHGVVAGVWDHECGMAATIEENDYVHQFVNKVARDKGINIKYSVSNIAEFERSFASSKFNWDIILEQSDIKNPDYVIFQIGENMSEQDVEVHENALRSKYTELLEHFPNSKRIITLPYWLSPRKNYVFTDIALASNAYIADLSHLGSDPNVNNASSEKRYDHPGVGVHPGNKGMKNIADILFSIINAK